MTPLAMALLCVWAPMAWMVSGILTAVVTSGYVKGKTAMQRLPKNILIILFWPFWLTYIINTK
ncbi:hypothetical protein AU156_gp092 [Edwardsiella phage PEi20]|uniref:Uncharacterized protein n=1 Tax=Edwardsiella phage PEi20 TaxID=1608310 RepID=A0A0B6VL04_9CAUD|nr:hypothetical protein AU156_gp092 [Edwardsiella phage PEi20]BAQ22742.1 hypothetical protein [Edwardsiella phage PEi20]